MANPKVPLRFQIFRGNDLIGEELISEPVIKVGKLFTMHQRLIVGRFGTISPRKLADVLGVLQRLLPPDLTPR